MNTKSFRIFDDKKQETVQANVELIQLKAMKLLLTNNDLAAEINVAGLVIGVSVNTRLIPIIDSEIEEIENCLAGLPNNWE